MLEPMDEKDEVAETFGEGNEEWTSPPRIYFKIHPLEFVLPPKNFKSQNGVHA